MLAPGDYLLMPVTHTNPLPSEPHGPAGIAAQTLADTQTLAVTRTDTPQADAKTTEPNETNKRSFLLILLTALGAVHT